VVAVLGAETAIGAAVLAGLAGSGFAVGAVDDGQPLPAEVGAVIDAGPLRQPATFGDLISLDAEAWSDAAEQPLRRALHVLQAAQRALEEGGGRIVVLLPSLVMTGAAGVAGWAAAAEGYRSLAKAAARAWGAEGIAIQCVLVPTGIERPGLQPPALDATPELAPILAALLDERLDALTGLTLAADGGVWMTS
jgi:3-oxoacyl-[acyl-carrier protein] reductase